jgi:hypothetical protein
MLIPILVTGIHTDTISIAKRGILEPRVSGISVGDKELILQRVQKGDPDALNLLFESCRGRLLPAPFVFFPGGRTLRMQSRMPC